MHYVFRSWLQGGRIVFSSTTLSIVIALLITAGCDNSTESDSSGADSPANSTNTANDSGDNEQQASDESAISPAAEGSVRFAAYNISFYRDQSGDLVRELENG